MPQNSSQLLARQNWLSMTRIRCDNDGSFLPLSTQGLLLLKDIEIAFCAGGWISVIVLSYAAIEAILRDVNTKDYTSASYRLWGDNEDLNWLRNLRNEIMHVSVPGKPSKLWKASPADLNACHAALEEDAQRAVTLLYKTIYSNQK